MGSSEMTSIMRLDSLQNYVLDSVKRLRVRLPLQASTVDL